MSRVGRAWRIAGTMRSVTPLHRHPASRPGHGRTPRSAALALVAVLTAGVAACGDDEDSACGPIRREALDSAYLVHVLGTETAVEYTSDPPTSGPHQPGPPIAGVADDPITRPIQVGILERGDVLIQHAPDLPAEDLDALRELAGEHVVVAPNPDLPEPVVATAWVYKRTCSAVDLAALQDFMDERVGKGPEG
jgi:hypothetical protein